jgi:hypothetical protein
VAQFPSLVELELESPKENLQFQLDPFLSIIWLLLEVVAEARAGVVLEDC